MPSSIFWKSVEAGVPQDSHFGLLSLSIHISDLDNLVSNPKLFKDNSSLFCVVKSANLSAKDLNKDPAKISNWTFQ